jgi:hypothetical protein
LLLAMHRELQSFDTSGPQGLAPVLYHRTKPEGWVKPPRLFDAA